MKILHISSARYYSGTERHLVDLCRSLASRGHEVFVALRPTNNWQHRLAFLPPENQFHVSIRNSFGILSALKIAEFIRENDIEIIHAHVPRDYVPASIACVTAGRGNFVLTRHMVTPLKPFNRYALKNLSRAIGVSEFVGGELRTVFPPEKVVVVPNGLDVESLRSRDMLRDEFRKIHEIGSDVPLIGILGDLREAKGQRDFVLAAGEVVKTFPNAHFVIAGLDYTVDRSFRRELRRLAKALGIAEQLLWLDWLDDTAPFYAAIDVFVSASHAESFGLAILEAMIRGTPVVATETDGARELLGPEARLVPINDPVALAEAICDVFADDTRDSQGTNLQRRAAEKFSLERMIDDTERIYLELGVKTR